MHTHGSTFAPRQLGGLLRGDAELVDEWINRPTLDRAALAMAAIGAGAGCYGAAIGWWRDPLQALYAGIKLPGILLLTAGGNALLNAMLAPLLGLNLSFRQSCLAILLSFAIAAAILGSFAPIVAFLIWNAQPLTPGTHASGTAYSLILPANVAVIAFAGLTANLRLLGLLRWLAGGPAVARRVLCAWLAGNLFLGTQISWILRPFIGAPELPVQFARPTAFHGNFYEAVFHAVLNLFQAG